MTPHPWLTELETRGHAFDFFQAVRLLQRCIPDRAPVGDFAPPGTEVVRFRPWLSLAFPPTAVRKIREPVEAKEAKDRFVTHLMVVGFMGLYGPQGVLPRHYTQLLLERDKEKDRGLREFLDIFNHRMIALFFRAAEKYRFASVYRFGGRDAVSGLLRAWLGETAGVAGGEAEAAGPLPRHHLLRYTGLFSQRPRSVTALSGVIRDYFDGVPTRVEQFVARWVLLDTADRGTLSDRGMNRLGRNVVVGSRIRDRQGKFRIRLGPLGIEEFLRFQPDGDRFAALCAIVREFVGDHLDFDVQVVLRAQDVPALQLAAGAGIPARLGRTAWLASGKRDRPAAEAVFTSREGDAPYPERRERCSTSTSRASSAV